MGRTAHEPGTVNHIGMAVDNGFEQNAVFIGVVLKIGVLHNHEIAACKFNGLANGRTFAFVDGLGEAFAAHRRVAVNEFIDAVSGGIGGAIVDNHQLKSSVIGQTYGHDFFEQMFQCALFVVSRYQYR